MLNPGDVSQHLAVLEVGQNAGEDLNDTCKFSITSSQCSSVPGKQKIDSPAKQTIALARRARAPRSCSYNISRSLDHERIQCLHGRFGPRLTVNSNTIVLLVVFIVQPSIDRVRLDSVAHVFSPPAV